MSWRGRTIAVVLLVLLYNTNFMNIIKFDDFSKIKNKNKSLIVQIFYNLKNHPSFHSEERLVNGQLISKRKRVLCWSINNISLWDTGALSTCSNLQSSHMLSSIQLLPVGWDSFSCLTTATSVRDKFCFKSCLNKAANIWPSELSS